jgi:hypothetical protein
VSCKASQIIFLEVACCGVINSAESGAVIGFTQGTLNSANLGEGVKQGLGIRLSALKNLAVSGSYSLAFILMMLCLGSCSCPVKPLKSSFWKWPVAVLSTKPKITYHINKGYTVIHTTDNQNNEVIIHRHNIFVNGKVVATYDKALVNNVKILALFPVLCVWLPLASY